MRRYSILLLAAAGFAAIPACGSSDDTSAATTATTSTTSSSSSMGGGTCGGMTDNQYQAQALQQVHDDLLTDITTMVTNGTKLCADAPTHAWDSNADAAAITAMKADWHACRVAYEHSEGAIAPLFPDVDFAIDARYDDALSMFEAQGGDMDLFDDQVFTGMHAMERILYEPQTPADIVTFEMTLPGYKAAAMPATDAEAMEFKTGLCQAFIDKTTLLQQQWIPSKINVGIAFQGVVALVNEQQEKVNKASTFEEESRYSQNTMADIRDNLTGTELAYGFFQPWIVCHTDANDPTKDGPTIDMKIQASFMKLDAAYSAVSGDAFPKVPSTWSTENPSAANLATEFGVLYETVHSVVDPADPDSIVSQMNDAAVMLGFPTFTSQ